jgi:hypothetical protein
MRILRDPDFSDAKRLDAIFLQIRLPIVNAPKGQEDPRTQWQTPESNIGLLS